MTLRLENVRLPLAHFDLDVSFEASGAATGLFGPSGAGKTTILELIAGIRSPSAGSIAVDGRVVDDVAGRVRVPARNRRIGYVPQGDLLFPHLTVERNIRFGFRGDEAFLLHLLDVLEIGALLPRRVGALSGGEAKRVALARALVTAPHMLLLDEPLSGLDRPLHARVIELLVRVRDELNVPMLYVSHDPHELQQVVAQTFVIERGGLVGTL